MPTDAVDPYQRERDLIRIKLNRPSSTDEVVLTHVLNILGSDSTFRQAQPCSYYGRFRDFTGVTYDLSLGNELERCLAPNIHEGTEPSCPFYLNNACTYEVHKKKD